MSRITLRRLLTGTIVLPFTAGDAAAFDAAARMMKRVEIEDARLASSVTEILMGSDVPPRKKFIYEHAQDAELDI